MYLIKKYYILPILATSNSGFLIELVVSVWSFASEGKELINLVFLSLMKNMCAFWLMYKTICIKSPVKVVKLMLGMIYVHINNLNC